MKEKTLTLPEIALIAGTRGMLGAGLGLLLADRLSGDHCRSIGWILVLVGAITTVPIAMLLFGRTAKSPMTNYVKQW